MNKNLSEIPSNKTGQKYNILEDEILGTVPNNETNIDRENKGTPSGERLEVRISQRKEAAGLIQEERQSYFKFFDDLREEERKKDAEGTSSFEKSKSVGNVKNDEPSKENNKTGEIKAQGNKETPKEIAANHIERLKKHTLGFLEKPIKSYNPLDKGKSAIRCACLYPDHSKVIGGMLKGRIIVYSIEENKKILFKVIPELNKTHILTISVSKCGRRLLLGGSKGCAFIYQIIVSNDPKEKREVWDLELIKDLTVEKYDGTKNLDIRTAKFSSNGEDVLIGRDDGHLLIFQRVFDQEKINKAHIKTELLHEDGLCAMALCPNTQMIATGGNDKNIKVLEYSKGELTSIVTLSCHRGIVRSLAFSSDGSMLLSGSYDTTAKLFETKNWKEIRTFRGHCEPIYSVAISPDMKFILTGSQDNKALLHDCLTGEILATYVDAKNEYDIRVVLFVGDGSIIFTCGEEGVLNFYSLARGQNIIKHSRHGEGGKSKVIRALDVWKNKILTGGADSTVRLFERETGLEIRKFFGHEGSVYSVAFSDQGRRALSAGEDCILRVFDVITGSLLKSYHDHKEYINVVMFSPTNKEILTGSADQTLNIYESFTGEIMYTFPNINHRLGRARKQTRRITKFSTPKKSTSNILDVSKAPLKKGTVDCVATFMKDKDTTIVITGGLKDKSPVLNVYGYSDQGFTNLNHVEIDVTTEWGVSAMKLANNNRILAACIDISDNSKYEIFLYETECLIKEEGEDNLPVMAKISLDYPNTPSYEIINFIFLPNSTEENFSFISLRSSEKKFLIESWRFNLSSEILKNSEVILAKGSEEIFETNKLPDTVGMYTLKLLAADHSKNDQIIFGTAEGIPKIINLADKELDPFSEFSSQVELICISGDGKNIAVVNQSEEIRLLDSSSGDLLSTITMKNFKISLLKFSKNGQIMIAVGKVGDDMIIRILDLGENKFYEETMKEFGKVMVIECLEKSNAQTTNYPLMFFGTDKGEILLWDYDKNVQKKPSCIYKDIYSKPVISLGLKNMSSLYCCFLNGRLISINKDENSQSDIVKELLPDHELKLNCAACSGNYSYLVSGGDDCLVRVLNFETLEENIFQGHSAPICAVGFFFETSHAISASADSQLKVFEVESGRLIFSFVDSYEIKSICVSPTYDSIILGTSCGLRILERVINTREKLLRFSKAIRNIKQIDFNKYDLCEEDLSLVPFPLDLSLLNIATIMSSDEEKIISNILQVVSSFSKEKRRILLNSVFRADERFNMSPWDWWISYYYSKKNKKVFSQLVDIVNSEGISGLQRMKDKNTFIKKVAETFPAKLLTLLNSFWGEKEEMSLQSYELEWYMRLKNTGWNLLRVLGLKKMEDYKGKIDFPVFIVSSTTNPADRFLEQSYDNFMKENCSKTPTDYHISTKVSVCKIRLDELFIENNKDNTNNKEIKLALSIFEQFEPDHSVFRSPFLETLVNYLWNSECLIGTKFYREVLIYAIFISVNCLNTLYFIPYRENNRYLEPYDFYYYQIFSIIDDGFIILFSVFIAFYRIYKLRVSYKTNGTCSISKWNLLSILMTFIGITASSLDIKWALVHEDLVDQFAFTTKIFLALFFAVTWFKFIEFAKGIKNTSSLIRIFSKVTMDMIPFFLIILFMLLGFTFTTYILQSSYDGHNAWEFFRINYFVLLGDFEDYNKLDTPISKDLFFLILFFFTVFMVIFMLNLLIAIISDSHAEVRAKEAQNEIYEKIRIINRRFAEMPHGGKEEVQKALKDKYIFKLEKVIDEETEANINDRNREALNKIVKNTQEIMEQKRENELSLYLKDFSKRFEMLENRFEEFKTEMEEHFENKTELGEKNNENELK